MAWTFTCNRRQLLGAAAAAAAAVLVAPAFAAGRPAAGPAVRLAPGMPLGPCRLVRELPLHEGSMPFELVDAAGGRFVVEVHRHDPGAPGIARAGSLSVYLRNGGTGATPTREDHGLGAMALAAELARLEATGRPVALPSSPASPRPLTSIVERWRSGSPPRR